MKTFFSYLKKFQVQFTDCQRTGTSILGDMVFYEYIPARSCWIDIRYAAFGLLITENLVLQSQLAKRFSDSSV